MKLLGFVIMLLGMLVSNVVNAVDPLSNIGISSNFPNDPNAASIIDGDGNLKIAESADQGALPIGNEQPDAMVHAAPQVGSAPQERSVTITTTTDREPPVLVNPVLEAPITAGPTAPPSAIKSPPRTLLSAEPAKSVLVNQQPPSSVTIVTTPANHVATPKPLPGTNTPKSILVPSTPPETMVVPMPSESTVLTPPQTTVVVPTPPSTVPQGIQSSVQQGNGIVPATRSPTMQPEIGLQAPAPRATLHPSTPQVQVITPNAVIISPTSQPSPPEEEEGPAPPRPTSLRPAGAMSN